MRGEWLTLLAAIPASEATRCVIIVHTVQSHILVFTTNSIESLIFHLQKNNLKIVWLATSEITIVFGRIYESFYIYKVKRVIKRFYSKQLFNVTEFYLNEIHIHLSMVIVLKLNVIFMRSKSIITEILPTVGFLYIYFNVIFRVLTV